MTRSEIEAVLSNVSVGDVLQVHYSHSGQPDRVFTGRVSSVFALEDGPVDDVHFETGQHVYFNEDAKVNFGEKRVEQLNVGWRFNDTTNIVTSVETAV